MFYCLKIKTIFRASKCTAHSAQKFANALTSFVPRVTQRSSSGKREKI